MRPQPCSPFQRFGDSEPARARRSQTRRARRRRQALLAPAGARPRAPRGNRRESRTGSTRARRATSVLDSGRATRRSVDPSGVPGFRNRLPSGAARRRARGVAMRSSVPPTRTPSRPPRRTEGISHGLDSCEARGAAAARRPAARPATTLSPGERTRALPPGSSISPYDAPVADPAAFRNSEPASRPPRPAARAVARPAKLARSGAVLEPAAATFFSVSRKT
jgi:hypothetical protein